MKRRRPLWRLFWCLLLGGLAWWLVAWGLEPRPRWALGPTAEGTQYDPICEDSEGRYFLGKEQTTTNNVFKEHIAVFDQRTGEMIQRLSLDGDGVLGNYSADLLGDSIWRIFESLDRHYVELRRWRYRDAHTEAVIHRWDGRRVQHRSMIHGTLILEQSFPLPHFFAGFDRSGWLGYILYKYRGPFDFYWFETWQLSTDGSQPRLLCQWTIRPDRWWFPRKLLCSTDGRYLVHYGSSIEDLIGWEPSLIKWLKSRETVTWTEMFVRCKSLLSTLVYDTRTGRFLHEIPAKGSVNIPPVWHQNMLLINEARLEDKPYSTKEILEKAHRAALFLLDWHSQCRAFRIDQGTVTEQELPNSLSSQSARFQSEHGFLVASGFFVSFPLDYITCYFLTCDEAGIHLQHTIPGLPDEADGSDLYVHRDSTQVIVDHKRPVAFWRKLLEPFKDVRWLNQLIDNVAELNPDVLVYDLSISDTPVHRLTSKNWGLQVRHVGTHLYVVEYRSVPTGVEYGRLLCYSLPLRLYSPWWARSTGLLVTLALWLLLTRRARRGVA